MDTTPADADERSTHGARRALVDEIRTLAAAALLTTEEAPALERARALVREATGLLAASMRSGRYEGVAGLSPGISETNAAIWETHAAFGRSNPLAPPVLATEQPGRLEGTVTFGPPYEGGPGTVYGGFIAAAFDGMLGRAVISSGRLGVTRSLAVRYLHPTPLSAPLRIEAEVSGTEDRDVRATGRLYFEDRVTAEAEAVLTGVDQKRYRIEGELS
jgi:acyl-coenzyme A thioesterase PaaI-like protein